MATSTITNTITGPSGTALSGVLVEVRLMPSGGFRESDFSEVARLVTTTTNGSGVWSLALERNSNITPDNSWYEVTEHIPVASGGKRVWNIAVGDSNQSLLASLVTPASQQPTVVPAGTVYLDQASADARYQALGSLSSTAPNTIEPDDAASAGVSSSAARYDHEHGIVTAAASSIATANAEGSATSFARSDHTHQFNPPRAEASRNSTQSITNGAWNLVTFNVETVDTDTLFTTGSGDRFTCVTAGRYEVIFTASFAANNTGTRGWAIAKGTTVASGFRGLDLRPAVQTFGTSAAVSAEVVLAVGETVSCQVFQNSGGALNLAADASAEPCKATIRWVAAS